MQILPVPRPSAARLALHDERTSPRDLDEVWDVAVVGTGIGGATLGYELARRGRRVIFLERGDDFHPDGGGSRGEPLPPEADEAARLAHGLWPRPVARLRDGVEVRTYHPIGAGTGGTSLVFGMMMDRLHPCDLEPRSAFAREDLEGSSAPERWPLDYAELSSAYDRAEALYRVRGTHDPLLPARATLLEPPPPTAKERVYLGALEGSGLHPYRMHSACESIAGCTHCPSRVCPNHCRNDALEVCLRPALAHHGARLLTGCRVARLVTEGRRVTSALCTLGTRELRVRAKSFVLAAGAYATPAILLRSASVEHPEGLANGSGLVGRNLMLHASDFVVVELRDFAESEGVLGHGIAMNDLYTARGTKLGNVHIHPFEVTAENVRYFLDAQMDALPDLVRRLVRPALPTAARIGGWIERGGVVLATVLEDLPYAENRLRPREGTVEDVVYEYRYSAELRRRNELLLAELRARLEARFSVHGLFRRDNLNKGHVSGTCRFGDDARTSVVAPDGRAHELDNLYVSDASLFPTSGGINPSLTIAALALRVAGTVDQAL